MTMPLRVDVADRIARVTIDNPPMNLLDAPLVGQLDELSLELADRDDVQVVVFASADPDFFIAHADLHELIGRGDADAESVEGWDLSFFAATLERYRTMPKVTIAVIEGRARGGGSEFALALDMRFAARETAVFGQPEVALGILPGGGGTQRLPALVGRSRALEAILGADDFDAELAERYGWINRALPKSELWPFVDRLTRRIATFPSTAIALAKAAVDTDTDGLLEEHRLFGRALATPAATATIREFLRSGGQTRAGELDLGNRLGRS
jgi:enoyl-CoA hydratase/carnithine racemase